MQLVLFLLFYAFIFFIKNVLGFYVFTQFGGSAVSLSKSPGQEYCKAAKKPAEGLFVSVYDPVMGWAAVQTVRLLQSTAVLDRIKWLKMTGCLKKEMGKKSLDPFFILQQFYDNLRNSIYCN